MLQLPTYSARLFFPPPALRFPSAQIRRCPDEIHQPYRVGAVARREVGSLPPAARGEVCIPRLVQEARTRTVYKTGRGPSRVESGVVSCPSRSTASVVACHARDSESTGQPCFTWRRFADSMPRGNASYFFPFFLPFSLVPSRITPGECGMFVGRKRGDQAFRVF